MKSLLFLFTFLLCSIGTAQTEIVAKELTKKEIRELKRQKAYEKEKERYLKKGLNEWGINEYAPNITMAIREHLPTARIDVQTGSIILRPAQSLNTGRNSPIWVVDGNIYDFPPNISFNTIREVRVFETLSETTRWGNQGRAGVIQVNTENTYVSPNRKDKSK